MRLYPTRTPMFVTPICLLLAALPCMAGPTLSASQRLEIQRLLYHLEINEVKPFQNGAISNDALIDFGVEYNWNEYPKRCVMTDRAGAKGRIAAHYVAEAARAFFDKPIRTHSTHNYHYAGGYYVFALGDPSEVQPADFHIEKFARNAKGDYSVSAYITETDSKKIADRYTLALKRAAGRFVVVGYGKKEIWRG